MVVGQKVSAKLPAGTAFSGEAIAVRDDSLVVDVGRTSDAKPLLGQQSIPRASAAPLDFKRSRGAAGKVIGIVAGVLGGLYVSYLTADHTDMSGDDHHRGDDEHRDGRLLRRAAGRSARETHPRETHQRMSGNQIAQSAGSAVENSIHPCGGSASIGKPPCHSES